MTDKVDLSAFDRIFGAPDPEKRSGRQRLCKTCGGWHLVNAWPHNCREPEWRPPQNLPAPMLIPDVAPHMAEPGEYIGTRGDQRDYMRRTGNVEFEDFKETAGTHRVSEEIDSRSYQEELVQDIKRAMEEDPLNRPPRTHERELNHKVEEGEKIEISDDIEVIGRDEDKHLTSS
jgi:hypothetical protein